MLRPVVSEFSTSEITESTSVNSEEFMVPADNPTPRPITIAATIIPIVTDFFNNFLKYSKPINFQKGMTVAVIFMIFMTSMLFFQSVYAEENVVRITEDLENVIILDGKWTHTQEWKRSGVLEWVPDNGGKIILRVFHDKNFIYAFVDVLHDINKDKGTDQTVLCLDANNNKSERPDENDYCFIATLESNSSIVLQGGGISAPSSFFKKIDSNDVIAVGTISDVHDRYNKVPHSSYEFKIPVEFIGRNSEYGLFISAYDFYKNESYSWPKGITLENNFQIPSPEKWGTMISPDKTLPEFDIPIIITIMALSTTVILGKFGKIDFGMYKK